MRKKSGETLPQQKNTSPIWSKKPQNFHKIKIKQNYYACIPLRMDIESCIQNLKEIGRWEIDF